MEKRKPRRRAAHRNNFSPRSSLESSLGGLWRFLCDDKFDECELLLVLLLMLLMFKRLCWGGLPKCGRVKKGANIGMPNCKKGAHGLDRGARCAATWARANALGCNPGGLPDMFASKFWWPNTILSTPRSVSLAVSNSQFLLSSLKRRQSVSPFLIAKCFTAN